MYRYITNFKGLYVTQLACVFKKVGKNENSSLVYAPLLWRGWSKKIVWAVAKVSLKRRKRWTVEITDLAIQRSCLPLLIGFLDSQDPSAFYLHAIRVLYYYRFTAPSRTVYCELFVLWPSAGEVRWLLSCETSQALIERLRVLDSSDETQIV